MQCCSLFFVTVCDIHRAGHTGRLDGELKVHCHDAATWKFPSFAGQVACRGLDFHFWDAVDDLSKTNIDLVFDDQRLYMHNAIGMFGSVPLTLSGGLILIASHAIVAPPVQYKKEAATCAKSPCSCMQHAHAYSACM